MARRTSITRLKKKYGSTKIEGDKYGQVIEEIMLDNLVNTSDDIAKLSRKRWDTASKKALKPGRRLILPDVSDVVPSKATSTRKAAEKGRLITGTLREPPLEGSAERPNGFPN